MVQTRGRADRTQEEGAIAVQGASFVLGITHRRAVTDEPRLGLGLEIPRSEGRSAPAEPAKRRGRPKSGDLPCR